MKIKDLINPSPMVERLAEKFGMTEEEMKDLNSRVISEMQRKLAIAQNGDMSKEDVASSLAMIYSSPFNSFAYLAADIEVKNEKELLFVSLALQAATTFAKKDTAVEKMIADLGFKNW